MNSIQLLCYFGKEEYMEKQDIILKKITNSKPRRSNFVLSWILIIILIGPALFLGTASILDITSGNYFGGKYDPTIKPGGIEACEKKLKRKLTVIKDGKTELLSLLNYKTLHSRNIIITIFIFMALFPACIALFILNKIQNKKIEYEKNIEAWQQNSILMLGSTSKGIINAERVAIALRKTVDDAARILSDLALKGFAEVLITDDGELVYQVKIPRRCDENTEKVDF